jgi:hypothetical protein
MRAMKASSFSLLAALGAVSGDPAAARPAELTTPPAIERLNTIRERYLDSLGQKAPPPSERDQQLTQFPNFPNFPNFGNFPNFPNFPNWFNGWSNF